MTPALIAFCGELGLTLEIADDVEHLPRLRHGVIVRVVHGGEVIALASAHVRPSHYDRLGLEDFAGDALLRQLARVVATAQCLASARPVHTRPS